MSDEKESNVFALNPGLSLELESAPAKKEMRTLYNRMMCNAKPEKGPVQLPSQFQVGDEVEIVLSEEFDETATVVVCYVFAVKFSADGSVSYDLAVPVPGVESYFTIISGIRGGLRAYGSKEDPDTLIEVTPQLKSNVRRSMIEPVPEAKDKPKH
jgi:hypothetical protein